MRCKSARMRVDKDLSLKSANRRHAEYVLALTGGMKRLAALILEVPTARLDALIKELRLSK